MIDAEHFFSAADMERITAAIQAVEKKTSGEIAVLVVDESDTYPEGVVMGGAIIGGLSALLLTDLFFHDSLWVFIPGVVILAILAGMALAHLPALHRVFVPPSQIGKRVETRAALSFYTKGLHKTRDASGVLFFLSLFEKRVWVLADQGIYQKITQAELQTYTSQIIDGIKRGQATEAICAEIARLGKVLARHFPVRPDDTNELPNEVLTEKRGLS